MVFGTFQTNPQGLMYHMSNPVKDFPDLNGRKVYVAAAGNFWQVLVAKYKLDKVQQLQYNGQLPIFLSDETNVSQCFVTLRADHPEGAGEGRRLPAERRLRLQPVSERDGRASRRRSRSSRSWSRRTSRRASRAGSTTSRTRSPTLDYIKSDFNKEKDVDLELKVFEAEKNRLPDRQGRVRPEEDGPDDGRAHEGPVRSMMRGVRHHQEGHRLQAGLRFELHRAGPHRARDLRVVSIQESGGLTSPRGGPEAWHLLTCFS